MKPSTLLGLQPSLASAGSGTDSLAPKTWFSLRFVEKHDLFTYLRHGKRTDNMLTNFNVVSKMWTNVCLQALIIRWSARAIAQLTYFPVENETFMASYLRWQLAPVLCSIDAPDCRNAAITQFEALLTNNTQWVSKVEEYQWTKPSKLEVP